MKTNLIKTLTAIMLFFIANTAFSQITITTNYVIDVMCPGWADGVIGISVSGGVAPYTYEWSTNAGGQTTEQISNLTSDMYTVTVTDNNLDTQTESFFVYEPDMIIYTEITTDVVCNGGADGSIDLQVNGGTFPYTYSWSNGETTEDINNLTAGIYSIEVQDNNGCYENFTLDITEPSAIVIGETHTNVTCNGSADGSVDLTVSGGTPVPFYSYIWSNGEVTEDLISATSGTYVVTVTDDNGCAETYVVDILEPTAMVINATQTDSHCGNADGSISTNVSGATPPYTYAWSDGTTIISSINNITAGSYAITVTDNNGCVLDSSYVLNDAQAPSVVITSQINVSCYGGADGSIDITVSNGAAPYTYTWSNAEIAEDISNLLTGTYNVTVTDANNCFDILLVNITEPAQMLVFPQVTPPTCNGYSNGAVNITNVIDGVSPYTYQWSNGQTDTVVLNLPAGDINLTVADANGCTVSQTITITEPLQLQLIDTVFNTNGTCNGLAGVTVYEGTPPYTYNWSTNETTSHIYDLCFGEFTVIVTDANGCSNTGTYLVGSSYTNTITFTDTLDVAIDTCIFNNTLAIDSAYIYDYQAITSDSVLLNWVFWQDGDSLLLNVGTSIDVQGNNLVYLEISCSNKAYTIHQFYGSFNPTITAVENLNLINEIKIFPNPSSGLFTIEAKQLNSIEIVDISGRLVYKTNNLTQKQEIDLTNQQKGIYLIKVNTHLGSVIKKIIIE